MPLLKHHRAKRHCIFSSPLPLTKKIHQELAPPGFAYSSKLNIGREQTHQGTGSCLPTLLKWTVPGMALVRADEHALNQFLSVAQERTQARNPSQQSESGHSVQEAEKTSCIHTDCSVLLGSNVKEYWSISFISTNIVSLYRNSGCREYLWCYSTRVNASSALCLQVKSNTVKQNIQCLEYHWHLLNEIFQAKLLNRMSVYVHHINCLPLELFYMFTTSGFCYTFWHWISIFRVFLSFSYSNMFTFLRNNSFQFSFKNVHHKL